MVQPKTLAVDHPNQDRGCPVEPFLKRSTLAAAGVVLVALIVGCGNSATSTSTLTGTPTLQGADLAQPSESLVSPTAAVTPPVGLPFPRGDSDIGSSIFASTCAICHGPTGNGDPGLAPGLGSPWHAWEHPDRQIREWIADGKLGLDRRMPAYGDRLDEQAISDVIAYVRTLWTQEQRDTQLDVSLRYEEGYRKYIDDGG